MLRECARAGIGELAEKDLRGYVSAGNNLVFVGSYEWLSVMNDVFGFALQSSYADGPYYRNDRNVKGTPFQWSISMLEQPDGSVYGVKVDSVSLLAPLGSGFRVQGPLPCFDVIPRHPPPPSRLSDCLPPAFLLPLLALNQREHARTCSTLQTHPGRW